MALLNFGFQMGPSEGRIKRDRERLLKLLTENQMVTRPQMGPERPGEYLGDITAREQGTGLLPEAQAGAIASLMANPQSRQIGQTTLQQLLNRAFPQAQSPSPKIAEYQQAVQNGFIPPDMTFLEYVEKVKTPAVTINQNLDKPLGAGAKDWRDDKGKKPSPTETVRSATEKGFLPTSTDEQKSILAAQAGAPLIANLTEVAFGKQGEKSLFPPESASETDRMISGAKAAMSSLTESDPRVVLYERTKESFVSQLARLSGQVGTLTDRDVGLVRGLFPRAGFTPEPLAKRQFQQIANLLLSKGVAKEQLLELGLPPWVFEDTSGVVPITPIEQMSDEELRRLAQ